MRGETKMTPLNYLTIRHFKGADFLEIDFFSKINLFAGKNNYGLLFGLFLFPDNQNAGAFEGLLEKIIREDNRLIFDGFQGFEHGLQNNANNKTEKKLTVPAKETKIYAYIEVLPGETGKERKMIKDPKRDYKNKEHWDLDSEFLKPLKNFLSEKTNQT
jgi:hypothetical protein